MPRKLQLLACVQFIAGTHAFWKPLRFRLLYQHLDFPGPKKSSGIAKVELKTIKQLLCGKVVTGGDMGSDVKIGRKFTG